YTFKPTKVGKVTFTIPGFVDGTHTVQNDGGPLTTGEVLISDLNVDVTVTPVPLATNGTRASFGVVRIKVTDSKGNPVAGQRVRLKLPQYNGACRDLAPSVLLCDANGARVYPPGDDPNTLKVQIAPTSGSGELVYGLWFGTERTSPPSPQLLLTAEAI